MIVSEVLHLTNQLIVEIEMQDKLKRFITIYILMRLKRIYRLLNLSGESSFSEIRVPYNVKVGKNMHLIEVLDYLYKF